VMMPAMHTAFVEQAVRGDSHQLSLLVKTAMLQSADQHRTYILDLTSTSMSLHPAGMPDNADSSATNETLLSPQDKKNASDSDTNAAPLEDIVVDNQLDSANKLLIPDPEKPKTWIPMPPTSWIFAPDALCPATTVRVSRGESWLEMNFNALTGNVENESTYFP